jgi:hypothetical protein
MVCCALSLLQCIHVIPYGQFFVVRLSLVSKDLKCGFQYKIIHTANSAHGQSTQPILLTISTARPIPLMTNSARSIPLCVIPHTAYCICDMWYIFNYIMCIHNDVDNIIDKNFIPSRVEGA